MSNEENKQEVDINPVNSITDSVLSGAKKSLNALHFC